MHELYSILGVSEDDIDIDIRYCITYVLREGILDLSEAWVTVQSSSDSGLYASERHTPSSHCR